MLVSRFRLPPATTSPQAARERLRVELADWGDDEARHSVLLLVTELVTNAVLHARSEVTIHVEVTSDVLRVQVDDESPAPPMRLDASSDLPGGRGLHLLDSLTRRWGVLTGSRGKTVWFEIAPEPA